MANGVVADAAGVLTLEELSADDITALLAEDRSKGEYRKIIDNFADSNDVYVVINLPGREQAAIVQSLKLNLAKCKKDNEDMPEIRILKKGETTILVNMVAHAAAVAASAE